MGMNAGGLLIVYLLGFSETTKVKELGSQTNKGCRCIRVCGMLITGQREVDWSKLTGVVHLSWLV